METEDFNGSWLCEYYNRKTNPEMPISFRIWHRSWLESVAIKLIAAYKKRKSNYFFKQGIPYNESQILKIDNDSISTVYSLLKSWGMVKGHGNDIRNLRNLSRHLFDYNVGVFLIQKCQAEIEATKFFTGKK